MGRFSCLYGPLQSHKHKKSDQPSFETMIKMLQLGSPNHALTSSRLHNSVEGKGGNCLGGDTENVRLSSRAWKSGEYEHEYDAESNMEEDVHFEMGNLRRSLSLGCDMDQQGRIFDDDKTDECIDQVNSCEGSHDCNDIADLSTPNVAKYEETTLPDNDQEARQSLSPHCSSDLVNHESIFSFTDANDLDKEGQENYPDPCCAEYTDNFVRQTPESSRMSKSYSMPNFGCTSPSRSPLSSQALAPRNRSFENLNILGINKKHTTTHSSCVVEITESNKHDSFCQSEKCDGETGVLDNYDSFDYGCSSKDWIVPVPDDMGVMEHRLGESSSNHWDQFPNQDIMMKRIEEWVIDLQHCSPVEETNETANSHEVKGAATFLDGLDKVDTKTNAGMEAAKRYISSLNAGATTAQLANHGLVAVPLLGAFLSLKVLNLSGNSIVRLTAGALPRGLHMLNLSKNRISTIEGLRELTRLRVLDLSYNKISRIGHGLASCSSVKELYLAGNKISEVEGLHRLLKLSVLDLRFNKIATSKSLGQLAANYNSLQAISLEGNPAQKNVGDEQLKKSLQGLLPNLAYYNRQHIKTSTLKDSSDRAVRLGISAHQFDRGVRSDHKSSSRRSSTKRASHSSSRGPKSQASDFLKQARSSRHGPVPPSASRTSHHQNLFDIGKKLQGLKSGLSLQKSRSEGTLAVV